MVHNRQSCRHNATDVMLSKSAHMQSREHGLFSLHWVDTRQSCSDTCGHSSSASSRCPQVLLGCSHCPQFIFYKLLTHTRPLTRCCFHRPWLHSAVPCGTLDSQLPLARAARPWQPSAAPSAAAETVPVRPCRHPVVAMETQARACAVQPVAG